MPRPTRMGPRFMSEGPPAAGEVRASIAEVVGRFHLEGADRIDRRVDVWRVVGVQGTGLVAERGDTLGDPPGTCRARSSAWLRRVGADTTRLVEAELHEWDAWVHAEQTGDREWLDVPRRRMYAERDRRTAEIGAALDRVHAVEVPAGGAPAFLAGVPADQVRALADRHAPGLPGSDDPAPPVRHEVGTADMAGRLDGHQVTVEIVVIRDGIETVERTQWEALYLAEAALASFRERPVAGGRFVSGRIIEPPVRGRPFDREH